jgi:DNA-binding PadR family transcriptional regulator
MADTATSTTSYAILGYLAIRPWRAYELTKQMGRTLHHFWPRAESGIYREMKRLVAAGLASSSDDQLGRRRRARYEITDEGREALRAWLGDPRSDGFLECEALVRVLFADFGTKREIVELLELMVGDATARSDQMVTLMQDYLVTGGQFPERSHVNVLIARFLIDFSAMVRDWAEWSTEFIDAWPDAGEHDPDDTTRDRIRDTITAGQRDTGAS